MNDRKTFIPQFKKNGDPKKGYSDWGERLNRIEWRKNNFQYELENKKTFFNGEIHTLECVNCGGDSVKKIYMLKHKHYAKYVCCKCYHILKWISKPKQV